MAVTFMNSGSGLCGRFLEGESGMHGLCCGAPTRPGMMFCDPCRTVTHYTPAPVRESRDIHTRAAAAWQNSEHEPDLTEMLS
jgi:hypothetical protein